MKLRLNPRSLLIIVPALIFVVEIGLYVSHHYHSGEGSSPHKSAMTGTGEGCGAEEETIAANDGYMSGLVEEGQKVKVSLGWYNCHAPEKGDIVLYRYSNESEPIIRVVRAVEGDLIRLSADKKNRAWNLLVNNEMVMAGKDPYYFGNEPPPTLSLYLGARKKGLLPDEVILLSNKPPGSKDSGAFGIANVNDLVGKVLVNGH